jgi:[ribosomal protein S5]-alanine N-acetyltransferase
LVLQNLVLTLARSTLPHENIAQTEKWVRGVMKGQNEFVICLKDPSESVIGKVGIWSGNEIGFLIARPYWRKGLAYEALMALIQYAFQELDFNTLTADADPRNAASIGLLKKCGFVEYRIEEKTFEVGGVWVDSLYLELEKEQWMKAFT